jgi:hypothetical protein
VSPHICGDLCAKIPLEVSPGGARCPAARVDGLKIAASRDMRSWPSAALAFLGFSACSSNSIDPLGTSLPAQISECETNTARVCGVWVRNEGTNSYSATWSQNSTAIITVVRWDSELIELTRRDTGGPTPRMLARYIAIPRRESVTKGQVEWTNDDLTIYGTWDASW